MGKVQWIIRKQVAGRKKIYVTEKRQISTDKIELIKINRKKDKIPIEKQSKQERGMDMRNTNGQSNVKKKKMSNLTN